jgi:hypothetical protein
MKTTALFRFALMCVSITLFAFHPQSVQQAPKIKQQINLKNSTSSTFFYNELDQLLRVENTNGATTKYLYAKGKIVKEDYDKSGKIISVDTFFINQSGRATLVVSNNGGFQKFEYDSLGKPQKSEMNTGKLFVGKNEYKWKDANQQKLIQYNENSKVSNTIYYDYYLDRINTISEKNMCRDFFNRHSKNLVKESMAVSASQPSDTTRLFYRYEFSTEGIVNKKITRKKSGELVDSIAFIYY